MTLSIVHTPCEIDEDELFDRIPDPLILLIFNQIADIKTLIRCRSVSKRFNSLVPQSDSLLLNVDRVISSDSEPEPDSDSFFVSFIRSIFKSLHTLLVSSSPANTANNSSNKLNPTRIHTSPTHILRVFENIKSLHIQLPSGDLKLEKGTTIKWVAHFGKTLKSCVILGFRNGGGDGGFGGGGLKMRVVWTISALIAASARHYMVLEVVNEQKGLETLVVRDKEEEGMVVMDKVGLIECQDSRVQDLAQAGGATDGNDGDDDEGENENENGEGVWWRNNRTTVPAVRMRMRHEGKMELSNGMILEGATLVVVRPVSNTNVGIGVSSVEEEEENGDVELAMQAFGGGVYGEAVDRLLKSRSYILEMNSF